jgi:hypothetical protein
MPVALLALFKTLSGPLHPVRDGHVDVGQAILGGHGVGDHAAVLDDAALS